MNRLTGFVATLSSSESARGVASDCDAKPLTPEPQTIEDANPGASGCNNQGGIDNEEVKDKYGESHSVIDP